MHSLVILKQLKQSRSVVELYTARGSGACNTSRNDFAGPFTKMFPCIVRVKNF